MDQKLSFAEPTRSVSVVLTGNIFLHGNPTSSYLWRNIIVELKGAGRCLAPDLIGMGQSKPSPNGSYRFVDHARYLDAWFDAVGATKNVTLVIHDWGSALGFHRAARFSGQIGRIAYMEAIVMDRTWAEFGPFEQTFRGLRSPAGEQMVLDQNLFIEQVLPHAVLRKLSDAELDHYRAPFKTRQSRWPTLIWPREIPVEGQPADVAAIIEASGKAMAASKIPKLFLHAMPGTMPPRAREFCKSWPNQTEVMINGVHYVQEDAPHKISQAILEFLRRA